MIDKRTGRLWYILAAAGSAGLPLPLYAAPAFAPPGSDGMMSAAQVDEAGKLAILLGQSQVVRPPFAASRVSVTDPNIADVQVLTPEQVLVMGKKPGSTDLVVWSSDERVWRTRIEVGIDLDRLKSDLAAAFPNASLNAAQLQNMLVVSGTLSRAEDATLLKEFLEKTGLPYVNRTSLAGIQQVQIRVRVAEVSRQALRTLGVNTYLSTGSVFGGIAVGSSTGPIQPAFVAPGNVSASVSPTVTMFGGFWHGDVQAFVQALAENQFLRVLAEPTLNCASGEEATFLAGGEFPVPIVQGSAGGANNNGTSISIEYKPFGVNLRFRPIVLGDNTIRLNVAPEVSDLSDVGAVIISGFRIPGVVTRRAETTLELKSGQTFALAGLLNQRTDALNSRIPGLGDIPILGALFRSVRYSQNDTELLIMVTADLVSPENIAGRTAVPGDLHNIPNDWELFATGKLEGANAPKLSAADAKWFHDQGIDTLIGPGAWAPYEAPAAKSAATARPDLSYSPPPKAPPPPPKAVEVRQLDMKPVEAPASKPPPPPPPPPAPKPSSVAQPADPPAAHVPAIAPAPAPDTTRSPAPITPRASEAYHPAPATATPVADSIPKPAPAPKPTLVVATPTATAAPTPAAPKPAATTPMPGSAAASESFVPGNTPATAVPAPAPKPHAPETFVPGGAANATSTAKPAAPVPAPAPTKPAPAPSSSETFVPGGAAAAAVPASAPASKPAPSETFAPAPHTAPDTTPKSAPSSPAATTPATVNLAPKAAPVPAPAPAPRSSSSETFRPGGAATAAPASTPAAPSTHSPETFTPTPKPAESPKPVPTTPAPAPAHTTTPAPAPAPAPAPIAPAVTRAPSSTAGETFRPGGASASSPAPSATHSREPETFTPGAKPAVATPAPSAPAKPAAAPSPAPVPAPSKPAASVSKPASGDTFVPGGAATPSAPKPAAKPRDPETFVPGGPKATPPATPAPAPTKPAAASTPAPSSKPAPAVQLPPSSKPAGSDTFVPGGKAPTSTAPASPKRSSSPGDDTFKPGGM